MSKLSRIVKVFFVLLLVGLFFVPTSVYKAAGFSGAVYTTDSACSGIDLNIYADKESVYLNGGPSHPGAAGLPDGEYFVKVTEPNGTVLGTSVGSSDETPAVVVDGDFVTCYQLSAILVKVSDATGGYDDTSNPAGEYKVWVSSDVNFANSFSKTDNFKIDSDDNGGEDPDPESGELNVLKFYDANANGINDDGILIDGWEIRIQDGVDYFRFTPISMILTPDIYTITESTPIQSNWLHTTSNPVVVELENGETENVEFGNLCIGAGGGHTLGFWSNKNGQALVDSADLSALSAMNLRNANGSNFDPATKGALKTWLLDGKATNMAYMLSVQMTAAQLNVLNGNASGSAMIYAPGTTSANSLGFATLQSVINEANTELGLHGLTLSGSAFRSYQANLKTILDNANNNTNFVQSSPCPFTFN